LHGFEIAQVEVQAVTNAIAEGALFLRSGFELGVRGDALDEVSPEIGGEVRKFFVAEGLDGANDGGGIDFVTLGQFAGGEEKGVLGIVEDQADEFGAAGTEVGFFAGEARFQGGLAGESGGFGGGRWNRR